ncbi:MAG: peptidoglycan-binding protein [Proteobacteria bacterium]|nr:MAG: peptidoglycan-binding protein [Pseudomonadota bacterium]
MTGTARRTTRRTGAALLAALLTACQGTPQMGQGGSMVSGSGGSAGAQGASIQLQRCARPIGTAALVEPPGETSTSLQSLGLASPLPLLRLMMAQSNCFTVVDRGAAMQNIEQEEYLRQSGMLRSGSQTARGRMVTTQYVITPNVIFSNPNAGGANAGALVGGLLGGGAGAALGGAIGGAMRIKEAQTTLFLTDAQSGLQVGVSEGSAKVRDFSGGGGLGGWGGGVAGLGGVSGYGNTAEGKLIAAALMDAHNKLVAQVQATAPSDLYQQRRGSATRGGMIADVQGELVRLGYLPAGSADGSMGPKTRTAIQEYQRAQGLLVDGAPSSALLEHMRGR